MAGRAPTALLLSLQVLRQRPLLKGVHGLEPQTRGPSPPDGAGRCDLQRRETKDAPIARKSLRGQER